MDEQRRMPGRQIKKAAGMQVNNIEYMMLGSKHGSQQDKMKSRKQKWTPGRQNVSQDYRIEANKPEWKPR